MSSNRDSLFELIPKDPLLEYHPNTVISIRKIHNLGNEKDLNEAIDILDKWVKEQPHFTMKNFPRKYLEITLISLKGSVERAKCQMDKLCTLKTVLPHFFNITDPKAEFSCFKGKVQQALLPKLTKDHYRPYILRYISTGMDTNFYFKVLRFATALCEYIKLHDYCNGYIMIADFRGINIVSYLSEVSISDLHKSITIIMQGFQMRVKAIHLVNESKTIELLVKLFKQLFSQKIGQRIYTHHSLDTLYNYVPKDILPPELGGEGKSLEKLFDNTLEVFGNEDTMKYFVEMRGATVDEVMRPKALEEYEMIGTFRSLSVD